MQVPNAGQHTSEHYCYICKKKPDADLVCKENYLEELDELLQQEKLESEK